MHGRPVFVISVIVFFGALAVALWAIAAATTWAGFGSGRGLTVEAVGAGTATLLAWYSWQNWRQARRDQERKRLDDERALLIRTLAATVPPPHLAKTMTFPRAL